MAQTRRGFGIAASVPVEVVRAAAEMAESLGYDSFWVNHPPNGDGLTALAHAAAVTTGIKLGVGVIPLSHRTPESIIEQVKRLNRTEDAEGGAGSDVDKRGETQEVEGLSLPLDRLYLGIGSGSGPHALRRVRAGVRALKSALDTEVWIAALGPKMSRLAGEVADGVLFNWLTPDYARVSAEWVREGASAAGRPTPTLATYVRCALGSASAERLAKEAARYASIPSYADHFARMGVPPMQTAVAVETAEDMQAALAAWDGVLDEIVVRSITPNDTVEETLALVRAAAPRR